MMKIQIEQYKGQYSNEIIDLILGIQVNEFAVPIALKDQPDLMSISDFYQRGAGNFWIARDGARVVGTIALVDIGNGQGALRKMFVSQDCRGKERGVAHNLLAELLAWASARGLHEIYLGTTAKYLAAQRFYQKHGFVEVQKSELPATFPLMAVDTKFFRISIL